jgi:hypothetical protein
MKPEGFPVEIADAIIRLLDIGAKFDHDFDKNKILPIFIDDMDIDTYLIKIIRVLTTAAESQPTEWNFMYYIGMSVSCLFAVCEEFNIDSMKIIEEKLAYNRSRAPKHGRQF